jgi:hypothetical protein
VVGLRAYTEAARNTGAALLAQQPLEILVGQHELPFVGMERQVLGTCHLPSRVIRASNTAPLG